LRREGVCYAVEAAMRACVLCVVIDIFTAARADWTRSAQLQGRPAMRTMFDEYIRRIRTNGADSFLAIIPTLKAGLEAKRQRLLRHLALAR
jgi:hypothetical protein